MGSRFTINKGINAPVEFRGLKAQWIWWIGGLVVALIVLFMILYVSGVNSFLSVVIVFVLGGFGISRVYAMNAKYGVYGMMKVSAAKRVPGVLRSVNRCVFFDGT